ncbi:Pol [Symbiodinium sp. CCMP2592]|nr:Pol [Symbiodinium sp. CCMP2592]
MYVYVYVFVSVSAPAPLERLLDRDTHGMPRSVAPLTSSDESACNESDSDVTAGTASDEASDLEDRERSNFLRVRSWWHKRVLQLLFEHYLELQLRSHGGLLTNRQIAGKLNAYKRSCEVLSADECYALLRPQLLAGLQSMVEQDRDVLLTQLARSVPRNDWLWIRATGRWGDPSKNQVTGRSQLLLAQSMGPRLRHPHATNLMQQLCAAASHGFYHDQLFMLWSLFDNNDRLAFQAWFRKLLGTSVEQRPALSGTGLPPLVEDTDRDGDVNMHAGSEPASGSRDPRPPARGPPSSAAASSTAGG